MLPSTQNADRNVLGPAQGEGAEDGEGIKSAAIREIKSTALEGKAGGGRSRILGKVRRRSLGMGRVGEGVVVVAGEGGEVGRGNGPSF